jgi:predicted acylesterase/phospholipase RssA
LSHLLESLSFRKTGRIVSITATAQYPSGEAVPLLLNYITTPNLLVASAVAASCALPGLMKPVKLQAKSNNGTVHDAYASGVKVLDGSVVSDIPLDQLQLLFHVSRSIVCQVRGIVIFV